VKEEELMLRLNRARATTEPSVFALWLRIVAVVAVGLPIVLACVTRPVDEPRIGETQQTPGYFPQSIEKDVDLLFVIDNSGSMDEEQTNLKNNFPKLIEALRSDKLGADPTGKPCNEGTREGCTIPNVHIGVISTDLGAGNYTNLPSCEVPGGDKGKLQVTPRVSGCTPPSKEFISYIEGQTNIPNADPKNPIQAVKDAFGCIAKLGIAGCGYEHTLESARRALDPKANLNPGFIRPEAFLSVIFITDEDDCSARNPQLFDPTQTALTDPLGPLTSFRCFEFGVRCDINDRNKMGPRKNCVPSQDWLYPVKERYEDFFRALKPPGRIIMAAIAGPTDRVEVGKDGNKPVLRESCSSGAGVAVPGIRVKALIDAFAPDSQYTSICEADFGPALIALGKKILGKLGAQCIASPILTPNGGLACQQGDTYGPNLVCGQNCLDMVSCDVIEIVAQGTPSQETTKVEKCPVELWYPGDWKKERDCGDFCPCWRIVRKETKDCDPAVDGSPYALDILRQGEAAKGTVAEARCFTSPARWGKDVEALAKIPQCQ
jgi:hypothetical protein